MDLPNRLQLRIPLDCKRLENQLDSSDKIEKSSKPVRIGVELTKISGLGDILHYCKIIAALADLTGIHIDVYSTQVTDPYLHIVETELKRGNISIINRHSNFDFQRPDILITPCSLLTNIKPTKKLIAIREFSLSSGKIKGEDYTIQTGLTFDPSKTDAIQSGISYSFSLADKILNLDNIRKQTRQKLYILLNKNGIVDSQTGQLGSARVGLLYTSSLNTNYSYIRSLTSIAKKLTEPVYIFIFGSGFSTEFHKGSYLDFLAEFSGEHVTFHDMTKSNLNLNIKKEGITVHFIYMGGDIDNIDFHNHSDFQDIMLTADFPSVITGDQSLAEAIQLSHSGKLVAPFLYYSPFLTKPLDFLLRVSQSDKNSAHIAASYLIGEPFSLEEEEILRQIETFQDKKSEHNLERFFMDKTMQREYVKAIGNIPEIMKEEKLKLITLGDQLIWESDTIKFIVSSVMAGNEKNIDLLRIKPSLSDKISTADKDFVRFCP